MPMTKTLNRLKKNNRYQEVNRVKAIDLLLTVVTFILFVLAIYLFSSDPIISPSVNWADSNGSASAGTTARWKYIVIHHSGSEKGNAAIFDSYYRNQKGIKDGLVYHFIIGNGTNSTDGAVETGSRWQKQIAGQHCFNSKVNKDSIAICLIGDFEKSKPTSKQMSSLLGLVEKLQKEYRIPRDKVFLHKEAESYGAKARSNTNCPGKKFPANVIKSSLPGWQTGSNSF